MIVHGRVLDVTDLVGLRGGAFAAPLLRSAGTDVSAWFSSDGELTTAVDGATGLPVPLATGVLPAPDTAWRVDEAAAPWWTDPARVVGSVTSGEHRLLLINSLTGQEHVLEFTAEETVADVKRRFLATNAHCASYVWSARRRSDGALEALDDALTPAQNGVQVSAVAELRALGLPADEPAALPHVLLTFVDDGTVA